MYYFNCSGHPNITAGHNTTFEFTKDGFVTETGDCIIGVHADFELHKIKEFLKYDKLKLVIKGKGCRDVIFFTPNPSFDDSEEMVIRRSDFICRRTLGNFATKSAVQINEGVKNQLKDGDAKFVIKIEKG